MKEKGGHVCRSVVNIYNYVLYLHHDVGLYNYTTHKYQMELSVYIIIVNLYACSIVTLIGYIKSRLELYNI